MSPAPILNSIQHLCVRVEVLTIGLLVVVRLIICRRRVQNTIATHELTLKFVQLCDTSAGSTKIESMFTQVVGAFIFRNCFAHGV